MIRVDIWVPDPAAVLEDGAFGAGALIRIERADLDPAPPHDLGAYSEVNTLEVLATSLQYRWWDPDGIDTSSYRWRVSNAADDVVSDYSEAFAGTSPAATIVPRSYASLDRMLAGWDTIPSQPQKLRRLAIALGAATDELISELSGRDYFRHPSFGETTWLVPPIDIDGRILHLHDGIVSLSTLEISLDHGATFATLDAADYVLRGSGPRDELDLGPSTPAFHVELVTLTRRGFPFRPGSVRATGVRGWPAIPEALIEGTVARARQMANADRSYTGSQPGPVEFGGGVPTFERWPQVTYRFLQGERDRFAACLFANDRIPMRAGW